MSPVTPSTHRLAASACLAASMTLVGSYVALSKPLAAAFPVLLLAWLRFGIAAIAMLPWLRKPANEPPMPRSTRRLVFLESFLGNFLFSICMIYGVSMTSAVSAGARRSSYRSAQVTPFRKSSASTSRAGGPSFRVRSEAMRCRRRSAPS